VRLSRTIVNELLGEAVYLDDVRRAAAHTHVAIRDGARGVVPSEIAGARSGSATR
jgi:hypothetical protein